MTHTHGIFDTDKRFSIDPETRVVTNNSTSKVLLMQHDHNSERFTFELPRFVEGHDMSLSTSAQVHYENGPAQGRYDADDLQVSPEDDERVIFSWLISRHATQHAAPLSFLVKFRCYEDGAVVYEWNTSEFGKLSVGEGMDNSEVVVEAVPDVIEDLNNRMDAFEEAPDAVIKIEGRVTALERRCSYGTEDMEAGVSELADGCVFLVYE